VKLGRSQPAPRPEDRAAQILYVKVKRAIANLDGIQQIKLARSLQRGHSWDVLDDYVRDVFREASR